MGQSKLSIRPIELKDANRFIHRLHRHHKPVVGHRYSQSVYDENNNLVGVAITGRPVARSTDFSRVLEVTRLCTDGTPNACSALYSASARVGKELGYWKIQTFILESEPGISLKAAGWEFAYTTAGGQWVHTSGPRRTDQPTCPKQLWHKILNRDAKPGKDVKVPTVAPVDYSFLDGFKL